MTTAQFQLRCVAEQEFVAWARMIADTYGMDRSEEEPADQRAATDLARTLAVFDEGEPVAGASVYSRMLTVPGGVLPVAGIASVGVAPTHRRRGILTSMVRPADRPVRAAPRGDRRAPSLRGRHLRTVRLRPRDRR